MAARTITCRSMRAASSPFRFSRDPRPMDVKARATPPRSSDHLGYEEIDVDLRRGPLEERLLDPRAEAGAGTKAGAGQGFSEFGLRPQVGGHYGKIAVGGECGDCEVGIADMQID